MPAMWKKIFLPPSGEIAREDPIGAYAIDYITHDCTLIVAYYEIRIDITLARCGCGP